MILNIALEHIAGLGNLAQAIKEDFQEEMAFPLGLEGLTGVNQLLRLTTPGRVETRAVGGLDTAQCPKPIFDHLSDLLHIPRN